jgi:hypothetical protein
MAVLFKGVGIRSEKDRPGDEINDMPAAPKPTMLLIEAKLSTELFKTRIVIFCVVGDKVPDATVKAIFVDDFTDSICEGFTTVTTLDLRQA